VGFYECARGDWYLIFWEWLRGNALWIAIFSSREYRTQHLHLGLLAENKVQTLVRRLEKKGSSGARVGSLTVGPCQGYRFRFYVSHRWL